MKPVLLDTGVIVAILQRESQHHEECVHAVSNLNRSLVTCEAVITESCRLMRRLPGAAEAILANVEHGLFLVPFQFAEAALAVRQILHKYRDVPASFADACLIQLADQLDTGDILTLKSDFVSYRWRRNKPFDLLIPLRT